LANFVDEGVGAAAAGREVAGDVGCAVARLWIALRPVIWRSISRGGVRAGGIRCCAEIRYGGAETGRDGGQIDTGTFRELLLGFVDDGRGVAGDPAHGD